MMKIEAGKYYRTRDGRKVGPMLLGREHDDYPGDYWETDGGFTSWWKNGREFGDSRDSRHDIIAEWADTPTGPVIEETVTTTRKRIVPGVYGRVRVWADSPLGHVRLGFGEPSGMNCFDWHPTELRAAAVVLNQLAEALDA